MRESFNDPAPIPDSLPKDESEDKPRTNLLKFLVGHLASSDFQCRPRDANTSQLHLFGAPPVWAHKLPAIDCQDRLDGPQAPEE